MGKVRISVKERHEGMGPHLIVTNTNGEECTVLQGETDSVSGDVHGSVCQGSEGGGEFRLSPVRPCQHRVELIDTDGDKLVFLRSTSGAVLAEYCNGDLVVPDVTSLRLDGKTHKFSDPSGEFQLPEASHDEGVRMLSMILASVGRELLIH